MLFVARSDEVKIDLLVTTDDYKSLKGNSQNGLDGKLGQINIDCGSECKFKFKFVVSRPSQYFYSTVEHQFAAWKGGLKNDKAPNACFCRS